MIQNILLSWFTKNRRWFPWREYSDPYRIMIAEFMLHRTRADQVVPVYEAFLEKYPDVQSLTKADPDEIKTVTQHLGLHWRSGHFIKAARYVIDEFNGEFPDNRQELTQIPGIGDYAAGAILTVCFNMPEHVVDSNIARFLNRYHNLQLSGEIRRKKAIISRAKELFQTKESGTLLFAVLDFTYKICKPRKPLCAECVLADSCRFSGKETAMDTAN